MNTLALLPILTANVPGSTTYDSRSVHTARSATVTGIATSLDAPALFKMLSDLHCFVARMIWDVREVDLGKADELLVGGDNGRGVVCHVDLYDLFSCDGAGVLDVHCYGEGLRVATYATRDAEVRAVDYERQPQSTRS